MIRRSWLSRSCLEKRTECKGITLCLVIATHDLPCRFRWVFCQLEVLRYCLPASIRQTLDQLPQSLDDTYLRVLKQIPQANQAHAHRMLQCLVVAVRPLRVEELAELLAFEFDSAQGGIPKYRPALRSDDQTQAVLSTCSSLVTIIHEHWSGSQFVQFSHFSVKEFLVSTRLASALGDISRYHISLGSAHTILTQACLGLLLHSDDNVTADSAGDVPLAQYAARHWVEHAQFEGVASRVKDGMETLFDPDKPYFVAWVNIYDIELNFSGYYYHGKISNPLYYSALCGFYDLVKQLAINHPHYLNAVGGRYGFPLLAALGQDYVEVAELLLEHGANIDVREATGKTILLVALSYLQNDNLLDIVRFLLKHGADVNARDDELTSSLHLAEDRDQQEVVQVLLKHKAYVNYQDSEGKTPLHILLEVNMCTLKDDDGPNRVRLLLEYGAEVNRRDIYNQTAFLLAMDRKLFRIARILLEHGADANVKVSYCKAPLNMLLNIRVEFTDEGDCLDLARLLLKNGAEVNSRYENNETPLHRAIRLDRLKLAGILLEHGAYVNVGDNNGMTPLHILPEGYLKDGDDILVLALSLLKHGAEVNSRDENNNTPLHLAIQWDRFKLAWILLEQGADANAENNNGMNPLYILSIDQIKDEDDVLYLTLLLLKHGAEVNGRDKYNDTPLHRAIQRDRFKLAWNLLEHGADANAEDNNGMTPLHILSKGYLQIKDKNYIPRVNIALLLLKHGAEVNSRDENNDTPLHLAIQWDRFNLAWILLENGADANAEDNMGMTPLHLLSTGWIKDKDDALNLALLLLKHGAEVNRRDKVNQTPLHLALLLEQLKLAEILIQHGADVHAETNDGMTPLRLFLKCRMYASRDFINQGRLLLERSMGMNRRDEDNKTPLLLGIGGKNNST